MRLRQGEAVLRQISDPLALAQLLCIRGGAEAAAGERARAAATLAEVETMAVALDTTPEDDLGRELAALRAALA